MANIVVTYEEVRSSAQRLVAGQDEIVTKLNELKAMIDNLVASGLDTDQAGVAFAESYTEFTTGTTNAVNGLEGLSKFLLAAADAFEQTDGGLASSIRG